MKISQFAQRAGVTVKTLLHYDKIGLLKPPRKKESGYRVYCDDDFIRLQQIITLKYIGLSLDEIKILLNQKGSNILSLIQVQKSGLEKKRKHIDTVITALKKAENQINEKGFLDVEQLIDIIKVTKIMESNREFISKYFSNEQLKESAERLFGEKTREELELLAKENKKFMEELKASIDLDPASAKAQELAKRWKEDIHKFTNGNPEIEKKLNEMYLNMDNAPAEMKKDWNPKILDFINKALEIYNSNEK